MNKKLEDFFNRQNESNNSKNDVIAKLTKKFKSLPPLKRAMIINAALHGLLIIIIVFLIIVLIAFPNGALEFMRDVVSDIGEGLKDFGQSIGNFVQGYGFQTDESLQQEYEEKYYKRLYDVYEYYADPENKYHVEINTTLITTTLFYNRIGGDLGYDCYDEGCIPGNIPDHFITDNEFNKQDVEFYKNAISKVALLAKMMLVENELKYDCTRTVTEDEIVPGDVRELVESNVAAWYNIFNFYTIPVRHFTFTVVGKENPDEDAFPTYAMCDMTKYGRGEKSDSEVILDKVKETSAYQEYLAALGSYNSARATLASCMETGASGNGTTCENASSSVSSAESELEKRENQIKSLPKIGEFVDFTSSHQLIFACPDNFYTKDSYGNPTCQADPPLETPIYTSEWYWYGFYYYNLMHAFDGNSSFLEKYYPDLIEPEKREEDLTKITDGIYEYYNTFIDNMQIYNNEYERGLIIPVKWDGYSTVFTDGLSGTYGIIGHGDYATWTQFQEPWGNLYMNSLTLGQAGCAFTSVSILIAMAAEQKGLDISMIQPEFNPGNFLGAYKAKGGYAGTDGVEWYRISQVVPGFQVSRSCGDFGCIQSEVAAGHYCTIWVNNRGPESYNHWVAVAGIVDGEIFIYDPGRSHSGAEPLSSHYPWQVKMRNGWCYSAG